MKAIFSRVKLFIKRHKIITAIAVIVLMICSYFIFRDSELEFRVVEVQKGAVRQEVNVTGRVEAADAVDLAFERSGRIESIPVKEGDKIVAGQVVMRLDPRELIAQRLREEANVQTAQAKLDKLLAGTRQEDIFVAETTLENTRRILEEVRTRNAVDTARSSLNSAIKGIVTASDIKETYQESETQTSFVIKKGEALFTIYGKSGLGRTESWYFASLDGGLKIKLASVEKSPTDENVDALLVDIKNALRLVKDALDELYEIVSGSTTVSQSVQDSDQSSITTNRTNVLSSIDSITTQQKTIVTAENNVRDAEASLALKRAPATQFEIDISKSELTQTQASLKLVEAQLAKQTLRSPIGGIVTKISGKTGEIVAANAAGISIISDAKFQVKANVPEVDIAKLKVGQNAVAILDAYGLGTPFSTQIVSINPGENIIDGIATYETIFEFDEEDARILSGFTADLSIQTNLRNEVLFVPTRNVITKDGKKYVKVLVDANKSTVQEREIKVGLKGSDGRTEIVEGLREGELIIAN